ncbi:hypothetical protein A3D70_00495 [Candidatus Adlerbacteria bacterium RIFCSPHIGHO2_02_FULL_54_18]|uniref:TVP38/TMEM64 family membrane protein n=2 Tax=Candidatus Adleribacteriota TaxID=1752736 RepID=A0A1F4Y1A6_9BACT|nr:MAG: hypothetical protein A2949_02755 [Candidatus Adlerbacteria bacterium RIFCSPLOWO2_01_FULL_54_21b]OGC87760.1 MAG: hypothetical protein A3D70_00495 [Candidatus Adlerbacteria bacterium RIFCSPHIGHO2_02_FULL_54_18]
MQDKHIVIAQQVGALTMFGALFVAASLVANVHKDALAEVVNAGGAVGMFGFILLIAVFVVFVIPLDLVLLVPLGTAAWGPVPTALMSIAGWTLGAAVAFGVARRWGAPFVERIVGMRRVRLLENRVPKKHLFGTVVALRMLVSVDVLSYALGLFSTMSWPRYIAATALGVAPFGFYFAYAGTLPFWYQIAAVAAALALASIIIMYWGIRREP